jgi:hypothetical protein
MASVLRMASALPKPWFRRMWQLQQHVQLHLGLRSEDNQPPLVLLQGSAVAAVAVGVAAGLL